MFDPEDAADDLESQLPDDADVDRDYIVSELEDYADFNVEKSEAIRSVINQLENVDTMDDSSSSDTTTEVKLGEINEDEQTVTVTAKVVEVWDDTPDSVAQKGLIGDDTEVIQYVVFDGTDLPELEEDTVYEFDGAVTDEYRGNYSIKLFESTDIEELDNDVEVTDNTETFTAPIVNVKDNSGLIERCPEEDCTYVVSTRACPEHGHDEGDDDLRILAHADNGQEARTVVFDRDLTETVMDMTLDDALELARDEMDRGVVTERMREELVGRYFQFTGSDFGDSFLIDEYTPVETDAQPRIESIRERAEELEL